MPLIHLDGIDNSKLLMFIQLAIQRLHNEAKDQIKMMKKKRLQHMMHPDMIKGIFIVQSKTLTKKIAHENVPEMP